MNFWDILLINLKTIKAMWAAPVSIAGVWVSAVFGDAIFLFLTDLEAGSKIFAAVFTVVIAYAGHRLARRQKIAEERRMEIELRHMVEDQRKENIAFLIEKGWIPEKPTPEEVDEGLRKFFPGL